MTHGADVCELRVNQLDRRQQPITRKRHYAKIREDIGKIASSGCQEQHSNNEAAESERLHKIAGGIGEYRRASKHPRHNRGVAGKSVQKMFFSAVHFYRLDPAKQLMRLAI